MRKGEIKRETRETKIELRLELDGKGEAEVETGIGFLDHLLQSLAKHSSFDLFLKAEGDLHVDQHHIVEDIGICLGQVLQEALGDKVGIRRFGYAMVPMDEALVLVALDISGRGGFWGDWVIKREKVGDLEVETIREFLRAFAHNGKLSLHVRLLSGDNAHHILEAIFKGLAVALKEAVKEEGTEIPSTKGLL